MIITNKLGLPQSFVDMASRNYEQKDNEYRVTSLLKGVRETLLQRRHFDEMEEDVSQRIWSLFGQAVHSILEQYNEQGHELKEERLKVDIGNYKLSGQFDLYNGETHTVTDYKTCSVWKVIYGDYSDWRQQLLIYAYMLEKIGFKCRTGEIVAIMKDHAISKAKFDKEYPQHPVHRIKFEFTDMDMSDIGMFLENKFKEIAELENVEDDNLPICTKEERWNKGDKYAVMKKGRKTALRVLDTIEEAEKELTAKGGDYIETRLGEDTKCMDYCNVNVFCKHWLSQQKGE